MKTKLLQPTFAHSLSSILKIINGLRKRRKQQIAFNITSCFMLLGFYPSYAQTCLHSKFASPHNFNITDLKFAYEDTQDISVILVNVYPNPATTGFTVNMQSSNTGIDACVIEVRNLIGQLIILERVPVSDGHMYREVSFKDPIPNGMYMTSVIAGGSHFNKQLIIQND